MVVLTKEELAFLEGQEVCRLATCSREGALHVVPVAYILLDGLFYVATDYGTKKYRNILENRRVALVVDALRPNRAVLIQGEVEILEKGEEYMRIYELFYKKFEWVKREPWEEGEAPIIRIKPTKKVSWGLGFGW